MPRGAKKRKKAQPRARRVKDPVRVKAGIKAAATRKRNVRAREREVKRLAKIRHEAACKGWATRRKEAKARTKRAKKGWRTRWFRGARRDSANGLRGSKRADWMVLVAMIDNDDPAWTAFLARAEELGFSSKQARDEWFSPEVL